MGEELKLISLKDKSTKWTICFVSSMIWERKSIHKIKKNICIYTRILLKPRWPRIVHKWQTWTILFEPLRVKTFQWNFISGYLVTNLRSEKKKSFWKKFKPFELVALSQMLDFWSCLFGKWKDRFWLRRNKEESM